MNRRLRTLLLCAAAVPAFALPQAPAAAQPTTPAGAQQPPPAWAQNLTPEQSARINNAARQALQPAAARIQSNLPQLQTQVQQTVEHINSVTPTSGGGGTDRATAGSIADGALVSIDELARLDTNLGQTLNPAVSETMRNLPPVLATMTDVARENGASDAEIAELNRAATNSSVTGTVAANYERAADAHNVEVQQFRSNLYANYSTTQANLTAALTPLVAQYGSDTSRWPPGVLAQAVSNTVGPIPAMTNVTQAGAVGISNTQVSSVLNQASRATGGAVNSSGAPVPATPPAESTPTPTASPARTPSRRDSSLPPQGTQGNPESDGPRAPASPTSAPTPAPPPNQGETEQQRQQRVWDNIHQMEQQEEAQRQQERAADEALRNSPQVNPRPDLPNASDRPANPNELGHPTQTGAEHGDRSGNYASPTSTSGGNTPDPNADPARRLPRLPLGQVGYEDEGDEAGIILSALEDADADADVDEGIGGSAGGGSGNGGGGTTPDIVNRFNEWLRQHPDLPTPEQQAAETARIAAEQGRLNAAAQQRAAQDAEWNAMVADRFGNSAWEAFDRNGGSLSTVELESIYANYDPLNTIPPASSLSSAGNSLSSAGWSLSSAGWSYSSVGWSLSSAGTPVVSGTEDYNDPAVQSLYDSRYADYSPFSGDVRWQNPYADRGPEPDVQIAAMGNYDIYNDPTGRWGGFSGGFDEGTLFVRDLDDRLIRVGDRVFWLSELIHGSQGGLDRLLAQPFNVILTWGDGAFDLDLHMTGPTGEGASDRFHIYFAARGDLAGFPFAELIKDCICSSGSEVILTSALLQGGVYRISVFNFGDQSAGSSNLSNQSLATIQIVRGGTAVSVGNGTTIQGGRTIYTGNVPRGLVGNTWVAVEIDPRNGRIRNPNQIVVSEGSQNVR